MFRLCTPERNGVVDLKLLYYKCYQGHITSFLLTRVFNKANLGLILGWNPWKNDKIDNIIPIALYAPKLRKTVTIHRISNYNCYEGHITTFLWLESSIGPTWA